MLVLFLYGANCLGGGPSPSAEIRWVCLWLLLGDALGGAVLFQQEVVGENMLLIEVEGVAWQSVRKKRVKGYWNQVVHLRN